MKHCKTKQQRFGSQVLAGDSEEEREGEREGLRTRDSRWLAQIESLQKGICSKSKVKHKGAKELKAERKEGKKELSMWRVHELIL